MGVLGLAIKGLRRAPSTTWLAVTILALGLAAPTVFFSLLVGAIRPLPVPQGERIVRIDVLDRGGTGRSAPVRPSDIEVLATANVLEAVGAFAVSPTTLSDAGYGTVPLARARLSPEILPLLRMEPAYGRIPAPDEYETSILIGNELWMEAFEGTAEVLGRVVGVGGGERVIVGVMPEGFAFPFHEEAWTLEPPTSSSVDQAGFELVGRLAEGGTPEAAQTVLDETWRRADEARASPERGAGITVAPFTRGRGEGGEAVAFAGLVLVALCLLLIACANVANLLIVRATERLRVLGIQAALGASRAALSMQLLVEALLLAIAGGAAGLLMAHGVVRTIDRTLAAEHFGYHWMRMSIDARVLAFVGALVLGTALVSGAVPALRILATDLRGVLRTGSSDRVAGSGRWTRAFVTVQLALSCAALVAAALTARSLVVARDFSGGLPADEILVARMTTNGNALAAAGIADLRARLSSLPGVTASAVATAAPGYMENWASVEVEVSAPSSVIPDRAARTFWSAITPGYFDVTGVRMLSGRRLDDRDASGSEPVAVVTESFALRHAEGGAILGARLRVGNRPDSSSWHTVVGVLEDLPIGGGSDAGRDRVFFPLTEHPPGAVLALVRTPGAGPAPADDLRRAAAGVEPTLAVAEIRTLADTHAWLTRVPRAMGALALGGGLAGLFVASVGLYGLLSFRVRQRRRELGVRLALGADRRRLARETLRFAMGQLVPAALVGLFLAWLAAPFLAAIVLGMDARSPATLVGVGIVFVTVGTLAAAVPTARAASTDPAEALRTD